LDAKLRKLKSLASDIQDAVAIAKVENEIKDAIYQQGQEVPYNITDSKRLEYSNESKTHSHQVATLEKHHGNVYVLITICAQLPNACGDSPYANYFWSLPECILGSPYAFGDPHMGNFA
jgi:hypothetical protein